MTNHLIHLPPVVSRWIVQAYDLVKNQAGIEYLSATHIVAENNWIFVDVPRVDLAQMIWNLHGELQESEYGVRMFVGGKLIITTPTKKLHSIDDMTILTNSLNSTLVIGDSPFVRSRVNWLPQWAEQGTHWIYKDDRDKGYPCEAIIPFGGLPEIIGIADSDEELVAAGRLTRLEGVARLVGKTAFDRKPRIREAVVAAISKASKDGYAKEDYIHIWGETPAYIRSWDLAAVAIKDGDYVVVITQNQDLQDKERWRKLIKR